MNCVRFCFWRCLWPFCLCMKYPGNRWTDLRQIHTEDVFSPLLGRVWRSKVKGKGHQEQKRYFRLNFGGLHAVCCILMHQSSHFATKLYHQDYTTDLQLLLLRKDSLVSFLGVCKTVCPMLSARCLSVCLSVVSVCNVGVSWPNGWTDQDETWRASSK